MHPQGNPLALTPASSMYASLRSAYQFGATIGIMLFSIAHAQDSDLIQLPADVAITLPGDNWMITVEPSLEDVARAIDGANIDTQGISLDSYRIALEAFFYDDDWNPIASVNAIHHMEVAAFDFNPSQLRDDDIERYDSGLKEGTSQLIEQQGEKLIAWEGTSRSGARSRPALITTYRKAVLGTLDTIRVRQVFLTTEGEAITLTIAYNERFRNRLEPIADQILETSIRPSEPEPTLLDSLPEPADIVPMLPLEPVSSSPIPVIQEADDVKLEPTEVESAEVEPASQEPSSFPIYPVLWGVGLLPPVLLRLSMGKPLPNRWIAFCFAACCLVGYLLLFEYLGYSSRTLPGLLTCLSFMIVTTPSSKTNDTNEDEALDKPIENTPPTWNGWVENLCILVLVYAHVWWNTIGDWYESNLREDGIYPALDLPGAIEVFFLLPFNLAYSTRAAAETLGALLIFVPLGLIPAFIIKRAFQPKVGYLFLSLTIVLVLRMMFMWNFVEFAVSGR